MACGEGFGAQKEASSVFCLAPSGLGFGVRLYHAIFYGCIPVIIQDNVTQPFEDDLLPYHLFSLRVKEDDIPQLPAILRGVKEHTIMKMQEQLACTWQHFMWSSVYGAAADEDGSRDAFATLLAVLYNRLHPPANKEITDMCNPKSGPLSAFRKLAVGGELCGRYCTIGGRRPCRNKDEASKAKWPPNRGSPETAVEECGRVPGQPKWMPWPPGGAAFFTRTGHKLFPEVYPASKQYKEPGEPRVA